MAKRAHRDWDESDVKIRPGKGSRPRTKDRPAHNNAQYGMVVTKDRGRWGVVLDDAPAGQAPTVCMRARELGRTDIVVGDRVGIVGDTSGRPGTLARIVRLDERTSVLRRTADDTDPYERIVVANADQLLIVSAVADPPPRSGFVERALVAAFVGGLNPVICLTKTDLASPDAFAAKFADLDVPVITCGTHDPISHVHDVVDGHITALIGHSGVGKSTLVNRLVPDADRATGEVSGDRQRQAHLHAINRITTPRRRLDHRHPRVSDPSGSHMSTPTPSSPYSTISPQPPTIAPAAAHTWGRQQTPNVHSTNSTARAHTAPTPSARSWERYAPTKNGCNRPWEGQPKRELPSELVTPDRT